MEYLQAFVLGIVQGFTEFLPISSTAHLIVFAKILGWEQKKEFVDAIQLGSVFAVVLYFWLDIRKIFTGAITAFQEKDWQKEEWKQIVGIAIGTLPALIVGYLFKDVLPKEILVIGIASIVMALLLGAAEKFGSRKRGFSSLQIIDGVLIGLGQTLALVPGVSRSGSTLTAALFLGLERATAARFSFLLGIPTLTVATVYESYKVLKTLNSFGPLVVGILSSFIFSYLAIAFLMRFLKNQTTWIFVFYRLIFGSALILWATLGKA
jgi:undecaprenyl-diphosphatase